LNQKIKTQKKTKMSRAKVYCLKCKKHTPIENGHFVSMKNGHTRLAGKCAHCGTKVSCISK